jgi:tRNA pseudouridine38-40 synthase
VQPDVDFALMNSAAEILYEYTDFTSFSKLHTDVKTNNCRVTRAVWRKTGDDEWLFEIEADRFLRNMVRAIVGTLLQVGRGKLSLEGFRAVIENKARGEAGDSAPGEALFLVDVKYPNDVYL